MVIKVPDDKVENVVGDYIPRRPSEENSNDPGNARNNPRENETTKSQWSPQAIGAGTAGAVVGAGLILLARPHLESYADNIVTGNVAAIIGGLGLSNSRILVMGGTVLAGIMGLQRYGWFNASPGEKKDDAVYAHFQGLTVERDTALSDNVEESQTIHANLLSGGFQGPRSTSIEEPRSNSRVIRDSARSQSGSSDSQQSGSKESQSKKTNNGIKEGFAIGVVVGFVIGGLVCVVARCEKINIQFIHTNTVNKFMHPKPENVNLPTQTMPTSL